ncbi:MAG: type II toxin-antitoxin system PemK/MazF family toxin [Ignavibacteriaceae bacterium]|nr:type II toxin-antitoxin system PemK/MazF family toxin [Ignavibacteriaceae bacterium]
MPDILRGDVYFVDLNPPKGSEMAKERRCVIVSNNIINKFASTVIVCPITDSHGKTSPFHIPVSPPNGGLTKESIIHCGQIRTIDKSRIKNKTGELTEDKMKEVSRGISIATELPYN